MAQELYNDPNVVSVTMEQLREQLDENTLTQPRIMSPIMNGIMQGLLKVGSAVDPDARVEIDGTNQRIIIYDESGVARILIGYQSGGF